jgi:CheY-like chemotaxis protein
MSDANAELNIISRQFMSLERPKKPKMLVVDDEPDNLDLLYRTFRRDFQVLRAESGVAALKVLAAEGEVAVIISDQRMPEMKGTEFLSKTVPQFPDTMRIILTGFTDVEDLVEAINSGQVYKYITKPWDPNELKQVVQRAAETYELLKLRTEELLYAQSQLGLMSKIVQAAQSATQVDDLLAPIVDAYQQLFAPDCCLLQRINGARAVLPVNASVDFDQNPLIQTALTTGKMQAMVPAAEAEMTVQVVQSDSAMQSHLVVPVVLRDTVLAVLSLQWHQPKVLHESDLAFIQLSAQQVGLAIASL